MGYYMYMPELSSHYYLLHFIYNTFGDLELLYYSVFHVTVFCERPSWQWRYSSNLQ